MLTIWKYPVLVNDQIQLAMPSGARILDVQCQGVHPQLWALVNPDSPKEDRNFRLSGTGHPIPESPEALSYIGTFQFGDGRLVFHLFEIKSPDLATEAGKKEVKKGAKN